MCTRVYFNFFVISDDDVKSLENDADWQFVTLGDQVLVGVSVAFIYLVTSGLFLQ